MIASLPMYDADPAAAEALWQALAGRLEAHGVEGIPAALAWPDDLARHWHDPALLLSQACGYPLVRDLSASVQLIGAFEYSAQGCEAARYRSLLVAREADAKLRIDAFRGRRLACNSFDSYSGYVALNELLASSVEPLGTPAFFRATHVTGSHRRSIEALRTGLADIGAIDCVTLATLQRVDPHLMDGLAVVGKTGAVTGLPLITAKQATPRLMRCLLTALREVVTDSSLADVRAALMLTGFRQVSWADYEPIRIAARRLNAGLHHGAATA